MLLVAALSGSAAGQAESGLIFGPEEPDFNGLPQWIASATSDPCTLVIPEGEDHGAYYALEGRATQNGIEARYVAAVEGMPFGDPELGPEPFVTNGVLVRLEGVTPGTTYTIEEPHGRITEVTADSSRIKVEVDMPDPQDGPIVDLTILTGTFRVLDGSTILVEFEVAGECNPFTGDPTNAPPLPSFTRTCTVMTCTFDASASEDPDGEILNFGWDFGDGTTGTGEVVTHEYTTGGSITARLTVLDDGGVSRSAEETFVLNQAPTAAFSVTCERRACTFDASASSDADGTISSYAWEFGDGTTATGPMVTHGYMANGDYPVNLTVTDDLGTPGTTSQTLSFDLPPMEATFQPHDGNEWWVQTRVFSNAPVMAVCASVNDGPCQPLQLRDWGSWAASFFVPHGSLVKFTATGGPGEEATSGAFQWPSGTPVAGPGEFAATFQPHDGNEWWVQTRATGNRPIVAVCAKVENGPCQPLELRDWGSWADSFFVPHNARVTFVATADNGEQATSVPFLWPSGTPTEPAEPGPFQAMFEPHDGNEWWVQTRVTANEPVVAVCASVNGGTCRALELRSWGSWADSFFVRNGSAVTFTATSSDGDMVTSHAFTWP